MLNLTNSDKVYLACGATDLRKSIDGLAAIVQMRFKLDPFSNCLFIFCNKHKDKLKILQWEYSGFWLYYKRLEKVDSNGLQRKLKLKVLLKES